MFIICLLFRVRKTNFPLRNLRRLSANIVLVQERHRKSCCTPQKYCLCLGEKKYISVALLCAKFCRKETWLEKEGNQGFRFADDASPASVTNADTNFPSPPSPTTTIIIPAEKNSLHSSPAVHQPLPPGKGDLFCIIFFSPRYWEITVPFHSLQTSLQFPVGGWRLLPVDAGWHQVFDVGWF